MSASPSPPVVVDFSGPHQERRYFEPENGGGGPPTLASAVLSHLAAGWPALEALRAAASARPGSGRLKNEISALASDVQVAMDAAFLGGLSDNLDAGPRSPDDVVAA